MSLKIDFEINSWIDKDNIHKNIENLNKLLNLGYQVSNMTQISFSPSSSILRPINDTVTTLSKSCTNSYKQISQKINHSNEINNMNVNMLSTKISSLNNNISNSIDKQINNISKQYGQLSDTILKLTGDVSVSSTKGKIGENYLENLLNSQFPDDSVVVKANQGHEADIHIHCKEDITILVESKIYKSAVNTSQIEKFYRDLERTGIKYGIFVSITSSIIGYHRLQYISKKDKHIIFIPKAGFDGIKVIYGVLFLKELKKYLSKNTQVSPQMIDEKCQIILESTKMLDNIFQCLTRLRGDAIKSKNIIEDNLRKIIVNILETEICTKKIITDLKNTISTTLEDFNTNFVEIENDIFENLIDEFNSSKNKVYNNVAQSLLILKDKITRVYKDESKKTRKYSFYKNEDKLCDLQLKKSKAEYEFSCGINFIIKANVDISKFTEIIEIV